MKGPVRTVFDTVTAFVNPFAMEILEQIIQVLGQIIGFFFAYHLLRLAYKLFWKKRFGSAALVSWASAFVLLCSLPWFQVWAKSFITTNVTSTLTSFGQQLKTVQATATEMRNELAGHQTAIDQQQQVLAGVQSNFWNMETNVNTVQAATTEMHNQLAGHQTVIDQHQQELVRVQGKIRDAETGFINQQLLFTNQLQQILTLQSELADTGTNLSAQGKKLSEIEHWVKNLYGVTTNDTIRGQEANVPH